MYFYTYMLVLAAAASQMFSQFLPFPRIREFYLSYSKAQVLLISKFPRRQVLQSSSFSVCRLTSNSQEGQGSIFQFFLQKIYQYTACFNGSSNVRHERVQQGNNSFYQINSGLEQSFSKQQVLPACLLQPVSHFSLTGKISPLYNIHGIKITVYTNNTSQGTRVLGFSLPPLLLIIHKKKVKGK